MITRGTTPTFRITFSVVDPTTISDAYLTIKQGQTVIEKDTDTMTTGTTSDGVKYIEWTLSQSETLALEQTDTYGSYKECDIQCRYYYGAGLSGATNVATIPVGRILKDGEIGGGGGDMS